MAFRDGILVYSQPGALRAADLDRLIEEVHGLDMDAIRAELATQQSAGV
jgi:thioredoxin 1